MAKLIWAYYSTLSTLRGRLYPDMPQPHPDRVGKLSSQREPVGRDGTV